MTWVLEVLCAQQEEVYVILQLLWDLEAYSSQRFMRLFFPGKYFLVIIPNDLIQKQMI